MNDDVISRKTATKALERTKEKDPKGNIACFYNKIVQNDIDVIMKLPSVNQKPLKYTGESICVYCRTTDCNGCMYEPMTTEAQ